MSSLPNTNGTRFLAVIEGRNYVKSVHSYTTTTPSTSKVQVEQPFGILGIGWIELDLTERDIGSEPRGYC